MKKSPNDSTGTPVLEPSNDAQISDAPSTTTPTPPPTSDVDVARRALTSVRRDAAGFSSGLFTRLSEAEAKRSALSAAVAPNKRGLSIVPALRDPIDQLMSPQRAAALPRVDGVSATPNRLRSVEMHVEDRPTREGQLGAFQRMAMASKLELLVQREAGVDCNRPLICDSDYVRIGSHPSNDIVLADPKVSRFHCRLSCEGNVWRVHDTESRNGTRLHGVRIQDGYLPAPHCVLEVGDSIVRIRELPDVGEVEVLEQANVGDLYGTSLAMRRLFAIIERVAATDTNVLIEGESGTGKELVATEIVRRGPRAQKPFVIVDCSSISPNLIESELFGHARGAFTGADRERIGAFEAAQGGTVFLDEIGEMPLDMQPKLLRALEAREIRRIGETSTRKIDVRVVAATNRKLEREINHGRFREDLYFRLSVVTIRLPALRERLGDLQMLIRSFLDQMNAHHSAHLFTESVLSEMGRYDWPGNVRELKNFVERTIVLQQATHGAAAGETDKAPPASSSLTRGVSVDVGVQFRTAKEAVIAEFEQRYVTALLEWAEGNISRAARKGGMDRMNLYRLIQRYGLREGRTFKD